MAAINEVCTGCPVNMQERHLTQQEAGTEPGRKERLARKASLRKDIGIYMLKDEQSWPDNGIKTEK